MQKDSFLYKWLSPNVTFDVAWKDDKTIRIRQRFYQYILLTRLNKPIGIYLLLWPTLWALWIAAEGFPHFGVLVVFVLGTVLMRSAGCAINDYADRDFDAHIERTEGRPLAQGLVKPEEALLVTAVLSLVAFLLVLTMNALTIKLSFLALALAVLYPFTKRFTFIPQVFLGAAFAMSIPMAFAAQTGEIPLLAWLIFVVAMTWPVAYDTIYAMVDRDEDLKVGIKSTAILFGEMDVAAVMFLQAMVLVGLYFIGDHAGLSWFYWSSLVIAAGLMLYQFLLIKERNAEKCFKAFLNSHYVGLVVFLGLVGDYFLAYLQT